MAKFAKDDCRYTAVKNQPKQLFSKYPQVIKESIFVGNNRKERRGISARFRRVYGKKAFLVMKAALKTGIKVEQFIEKVIQQTVPAGPAQSVYSKSIFGY